ncbi:MAG: ABC transporter permease [Candidatus Brocadiia bacterium]
MPVLGAVGRTARLTWVEVGKLFAHKFFPATLAITLVVTAGLGFAGRAVSERGGLGEQFSNYTLWVLTSSYGLRVGTVLLVALGALAMSTEATACTLNTVLARPIRRLEFALAKSLALVFATVAVVGAAALGGFLVGGTVEPRYGGSLPVIQTGPGEETELPFLPPLQERLPAFPDDSGEKPDIWYSSNGQGGPSLRFPKRQQKDEELPPGLEWEEEKPEEKAAPPREAEPQPEPPRRLPEPRGFPTYGDVVDPSYPEKVIASRAEVMGHLVLGFLLMSVPILAAVSLGFLLGTLLDSSGLATGLAVGLFVSLEATKFFPPVEALLGHYAYNYPITKLATLVNYAGKGEAPVWEEALAGVRTSALYAGVFFLISFIRFWRRDVTL